MASKTAQESRAINCTGQVPSDSRWLSTCSPASEALPAQIRDLLTLSLSDNSKRAYRADLKQFEASGRTLASAEMV